MEAFTFEGRRTKERMLKFREYLYSIQDLVDFKLSARGWAYLMENKRLVNKDEFDKVEDWMNACRREGVLPIDFTAAHGERAFKGVKVRSDYTIAGTFNWMLSDVENGHRMYEPDWWNGEECYIQCVVEKIDLVGLFKPICDEYNIPIANARGWPSLLQRATYCDRFKLAEERGMKCVLLYCGDLDPDGVRISDTLIRNLMDVSEVVWSDGRRGYDPKNLIIDRFGLSEEIIKELDLTWIDNLITGSGGYIAQDIGGEIVQGRTANGRPHQNFEMDYAQEYLRKYGVKKCEANAIIPYPTEARQMIRDEIEGYLGEDALDRFKEKRVRVEKEYRKLYKLYGIGDAVNEAMDRLEEDEVLLHSGVTDDDDDYEYGEEE